MRPGAGLYLFIYLFIYLYIYSRYVFTGTHPLGPRWPPAGIRSFTSIQVAHTHQKKCTHQGNRTAWNQETEPPNKKGKGWFWGAYVGCYALVIKFVFNVALLRLMFFLRGVLEEIWGSISPGMLSLDEWAKYCCCYGCCEGLVWSCLSTSVQ